MNAHKQTSTATVEPVLVECYSDGFIRTYGSKNVHCIIINRPHASSQATGRQVEELIDSILPAQFLKVYFPGMVRATGQLRKLTPQRVQELADIVHLFDQLKDKPLALPERQVILRILGGGR